MADFPHKVDLGKRGVWEVRAPIGTPPGRLRELAVAKGAPVVPGMPTQLGLQVQNEPIAPGEGGFLSSLARTMTAAGRGFMAPRQQDPFGLNPENRSPFTILNAPYDIARGGLEIAESLYGGLKQGVGQAVYETGLSAARPEKIAKELFEPLEIASMAAFPTPAGVTRAGVARTAARTPAQRLVEAGERQRVRLMPAQVAEPGGVMSALTGASSSSLFGGPVRRAAREGTQNLRRATLRTADIVGDADTPLDEAGRQIIEGARNYQEVTSNTGNYLYRRAQQLAPNIQITPNNALRVIDDELAAAARSNDTTSPYVRELQRYRDRLADPNGLPIDGLTRVIQEAKRAGRHEEALRGTNLNRVMNNVARTAEQDMLGAINATGNTEAARAYRHANRYWRTRVDVIDNVLEPIVGPGKSGEDVVRAIESMARSKKGGVARLSGLLNAVPRNAQGDVRAVLIDRIGRAKAGEQGAEGGVFSPQTFLTNWNDMSPEGKNALFGNNTRMRRDLDDVAALSESARDVAKFGNVSGTGRAGELVVLGGMATTAATTFHPLAIAALAALPALGAAGARLLASPRFVRLLARARNTNAPAWERTFKQGLKELAVREPALAGPVAALSEKTTTAQPELSTEQPVSKAPDLSMYEKYSEGELEMMANPELYEGLSEEELEALAKGSEPTLAPSPDLQ